MRNTPRPLFADDAPRPGWSVDAAPTARLGMLFGGFLCVFVVILARVVWLQVAVPDRFLAVWDQPVETLEPIPARDGRILSADGQVLAFDAPRFDLLVHYRWLEEPANEDWLTATVRARLSRQDRRKKDRVAAAREEILRERVRLWQALVEVAGRSPSQLTAERAAIQSRIERMLAAVEKQRRERASPLDAEFRPAQGTGLREMWDRVVRELTTPPQRERPDPLVLREQQEYHVVVRDIPLEAVATIEAHGSQFPGVRTEVATDRVYPHGDLAAHVIGLRQPIGPEDLLARQERFPAGDPLDYRAGDRIGRSGIERAYESVIRGQRGERRITKNRREEILSSVVVRPPRDGTDVTLTFDLGVQRRAEQLLDAALSGMRMRNDESPGSRTGDISDESVPAGGCIVAIDVRTGAILTAASAPRIDLQTLSRPDAETWKRISQDPRQPLFPRMTQAAVPPGSVFKVVTAIAGLQEGAIQPDEPFLCRGYLNTPERDRCSIFRTAGRGHGDTTLADALCQSCNVYFFDAATRLSPLALEDWSRRFGLGAPTGIDLPGERAGTVPSPRPQPGEPKWFPGTTRQMAIGQASLTTTPLEVARLMAAIANDGYLVPLHVGQERPEQVPTNTSPSGIELVAFASSEGRSRQRIEGLLPGTLERIRTALRMVVEDPRGTGRLVQLEAVPIAGKTGTAETGGERPDHAWFAGYAPADRPRVAFVVFLEHGGSGGKQAGPLARELVRTLRDAGQLR